MRIMIVVKSLGIGGVSNSALELQSALERRGNWVDIFSREEMLDKNTFFRSIFHLRWWCLWSAKKTNERDRKDIIYTQDWSLTFPLLFPWRILKNKHFACFCGREETKSKFLQNWVGRRMGKNLVVIGNKLKKDFPEATLIYRGVNFDKFKPLRKKREYVGMVDKESESLTIKDLNKIGKKTGLKPLVAATIPTEKMNREFYNKCKVFISLPPQAGYNNVWNEAMAAGVPIVIGNTQGAGSILPIERVPLKADYVSRIVNIIENPRKMNYRRWLIDNDFSWDSVAKQLIEFFEMKLKKEEKE